MIILGNASVHGINADSKSYPDTPAQYKDLYEKGYLIADWGYLVKNIIGGTETVPGATQVYNKNTFIVKDKYHPNMLSGYITTLFAYCTITGEKASGQPYMYFWDADTTPDDVEETKQELIEIKGNDEEIKELETVEKVLYSAIEEELGIKVKIGVGNPVANFESINSSYLQAKKALELGAEIADKSVYTYTEILPLKMISSLTEKEKIEFLKPFKQILKNEELSVTAKEFLNNDLNSKRTAEKLFIHRNTLTYRLNKIEKEIGLDLRNFGDAVTFRMVCLMYNIKENNE